MSTTPEMRTSYDLDSTDMLVRGSSNPCLGTPEHHGRLHAAEHRSGHRQQLSVDRRAVFRYRVTRPPRPTRLPAHDLLRRHRLSRHACQYGGEVASIACRTASGTTSRSNAFDFRRFDVQMQQFVPLVASHNHVMSGRIGASYINNADGQSCAVLLSARTSAAWTRSAASANSGSRTKTRSG